VRERAAHIAEWIRLTEVQSGQVAQIESKRADRRGHRTESGISAASRQLGIERTEARRALKIDGIAPEAKEADDRGNLFKLNRFPRVVQVEPPKGAWFTAGPRGRRATVGLPGSGLFWTERSIVPHAVKGRSAGSHSLGEALALAVAHTFIDSAQS
jgi:hypothetical protein